MATKGIEKNIVKYLNNQASFNELDDLDLWVNKTENEQEFLNYVKINYAIDCTLKKTDNNKIKNLIANLMKEEKRLYKKRRLLNYVKYAAVFVGVIISVYFFKNGVFNLKEQDASKTTIVNSDKVLPGTDKATLTLEDGSVIALKKGNSYQNKNATSNGKNITYKSKSNPTPKVAYNYLTVPRGGQFHVVLADGTKVWLNSESQLKYPVTFAKGVDREVELVYGEAYFDVSPSTKHNGTKFKVFNQSQEIEVLGTEFNIKAYKDETNIYTTLVEGKVWVHSEWGNRTLKPSQQTNLNILDKTVAINTVNVLNEIAWKDGLFRFYRMRLDEIMKVLSRWYDLEVQFANLELKKAGFNGTIGRDQNIEEILKIIKSFGVIKNYELKDKTLILN
ncbi:FecR family protein [Polaribacter batillariae]|uniref:FecR family protein n=1 Tax=Polaribacter batillariae TaxID=2808900 RepID=A0ABX7SW24_9FLAO|nr:FecR family protein [Polaribacter batillariae]QTD38454.1 FecR family protein [Polaribacter batillariae]